MGRHTLPAYMSGRHRLERPDRLHCRLMPAVAARLQRRRWARLAAFGRQGRHTWAWLARSGGQPRPAFALILSL